MDLQTALNQLLAIVITGFVTTLLPVLLVYIFKTVKNFAALQWHKLSIAKQQQLTAYAQQVTVAFYHLVNTDELKNDLLTVKKKIEVAVQAYADLHHIPVAVGQIEVEVESAWQLVFK